MQEAQQNLTRAAIEFLQAAEATVRSAQAAQAADPLDEVGTDLFELGDFEPVVDMDDLAELKRRLRQERLLPAAIMELVGLARQVAAVLAQG